MKAADLGIFGRTYHTSRNKRSCKDGPIAQAEELWNSSRVIVVNSKDRVNSTQYRRCVVVRPEFAAAPDSTIYLTSDVRIHNQSP